MSDIQVCLSGHLSCHLSDYWTGYPARASSSCLGDKGAEWPVILAEP